MRGTPTYAERVASADATTPAMVAAVLSCASERYGVDVPAILSGDRTGPVCVARHVAYTALYLLGGMCSDIARAVGRHDSTITHGVRGVTRDAHDAHLLAAAYAVAEQVRPPSVAAALSWMLDAPDAERAAIVAYCERALLGQGRAAGTWCVWGLLLLERPGYRAAVERALIACGRGEQVGHIAMQLRACGHRGAA